MSSLSRRSLLPIALFALALLIAAQLLALPAAAAGTLLGRWSFEEGSGASALDSSGNGYDGALTGSFGWSAAVPPALASGSSSLDIFGNTSYRIGQPRHP